MPSTLLLLAAALIAFGGALWAPFHLDDFALLSDPVVTSPSGWLDSWRIGQSRPLTWFTFWLNHTLGGADPVGYHLVNLGMHLASVAILCGLTRGRGFPAACLIFALHPIQTEPVVYVFARATLLMTLFCLLSLREWLAGRPWHAAAWFLPAVLSKEECVSFPLFLMIAGGAERPKRASLAVMLAIAALAGLHVLYAAAANPGSGAGAGSAVTPLQYLAAQGPAILRYARLLILPWGFTPESPLSVPGPAVAAAAWAAVAFALAWLPRVPQWRWLAGALILLAPSTTFLPADDLSADRRLYLPLAAIALWAATALKPRPAAGWAAAGLLTAVSVYQTSLWIRPAELWRRAVELAPGKVRPYIQLARALPAPDAETVLEQARRLAPDDARIPSELGRIFLESGRADLALSQFGRALALEPAAPSAIVNRGVALWKMGQTDAAKADFHRALALDPCHLQARANLTALGEAAEKPARCR